MDDVLTLAEAAERMRLSESYVRKLAAAGALPHYRLGRALRFSSADVEAYLERHRHAAEAVAG